MTTETQNTNETTDSRAKRPFVKRLVMRFSSWRKRRAAKRLYRRIWKANEIILMERHGKLVKRQNRFCWKELEACSDALERAAVVAHEKYEFQDA
jgi:hypothetical protein